MKNLTLAVLALVAAPVLLNACQDSAAGADASNAGCPPSTKPQFDPNTGKLTSCQPDNDAGSVAQQDNGSGSGTASDSGAKTELPSTGGSDATKPGSDTADQPDEATFQMPECKPGATGLDKWFGCVPTPGKSGKLHGEPCTDDSECLYGNCMKGLPIVNYDKNLGVCTKNCGYIGGGSKFISCSSEDDNPKGVTYSCVTEKTVAIGNSKQDTSLPSVFKMCVRGCLNDAECQAWNPDMPTCYNGNSSTNELSTPPKKLCLKLPPK